MRRITKIPKNKFLVGIYDSVTKEPLNRFLSTSRFLEIIETEEEFEVDFNETTTNFVAYLPNKESKTQKLKVSLYLVDSTVFYYLHCIYGASDITYDATNLNLSYLHKIKTVYGDAQIFIFHKKIEF
jgi:hypothetical protein